MKKIIVLIFLILFGIFKSDGLLAEIELSLDRNNIREKETFQLTINVENPASLQASQELDFLPVEFQVLSSERFQKSTVINGKFANRMGWALQLVSTTAGTFTIPAFTLGNESSKPMTIRILPALDELDEINPNSKIKLSANISEQEVYVQQQIVYTVRIYSSVPTRRRSMSALQVDNAVVEKLGDSAEFQMVNKGVTYNVLEEKYAIFPQQSGELSIPSIQFRTNIVDIEASFGSLSRYRPIELSSQPFKVSVKPKPQAAESLWTPAKMIKITAEWQPKNQKFEVGTPASLDFIIKGVGLLPEQLPEVTFPDIDGLKIYRDKPNIQTRINSNGVNSYHLEKLAIIPNKAGEITIPKISIPFWNTTEDKQDYATLEPMTISIKEQQNAVALPAISQQSQTPITNKISLPSQAGDHSKLWKIAALLFATLWFLTTLAFIVLRPSTKKIKTQSNHQSIHKKTTTEQLNFKRACSSQDPKVIAQAAIQWVDQRSHYSVTNLAQLINHCPNAELRSELIKLQTALYAEKKPTTQEWNGQKIYQLLTQIIFAKQQKRQPQELPPLYPK